MVDKVLSELERSCDRFVLVIDDLHELTSPAAAAQLRRIYAKLGAANRTAAVERGRELRLLSVGRT
jgi:ATP/maltotriose-dependent transcriptional regulator MalT